MVYNETHLLKGNTMPKAQSITDLTTKSSTRRKIEKAVNYTLAGTVAVLLVTAGVKKFQEKSDETVEA